MLKGRYFLFLLLVIFCLLRCAEISLYLWKVGIFVGIHKMFVTIFYFTIFMQ
jgi:hypothetical protein